MNFIQSDRASESQPINLDHVITFGKTHAGSTTIIFFETSDGKTILWRYFKNRKYRDLDYEELIQLIFI